MIRTIKMSMLAFFMVWMSAGFLRAESAAPVKADTAKDKPAVSTSPVIPPAAPETSTKTDIKTEKTNDTLKKENDAAVSPAMSLQDFVRLVMKNNETILVQHADYRISWEKIMNEKASFEPQLVNSYARGEDHARYSNEDKTAILVASEKNERTADFNAAVEGKIPTGAKVKVGYTMRDYLDRASTNTQEQYKGFFGVEITQPLLKDAGGAAISGIRVAKADSRLSFQSLRLKMMETVMNALGACWDLYAATEKLAIRKSSVQIAQTILEDNRVRFKLGKMAETEVLEAEAGLARRKSQESRARQDMTSAMNRAKMFVSMSDVKNVLNLDFKGHVASERTKPEFDPAVNEAMKNRPEYLAAKMKINREDILIKYAENQRWPQLDLTGSYGLNGLGTSPGNAWSDEVNQDYHTWKVGVTLTIPLMGGLKTKSELAIARQHKHQAILEMKAAETDLVNRVDTAVKEVMSAYEQVDYSTKAREVYKRLLDVEMVMLAAGRSNSRSVLDKEEDLNAVRDAEVDNIAYSRKAEIALALAQGLLLKHYDVEVVEEKVE